jgi:hypothetical protein
VETIATIRRAYFGQGKPIKVICRELNVSREVVRKVIRTGATEFRYERESQPLLSLYAKRLDRGNFIWPTPRDGAVAISAAQLGYMLDGIDWRNPRWTWRPEAAG